MTDDQIARRYPDADFGLARLHHLWQLRLVRRWYETLEGAHVFSPTARTRQVVSLPGVHPREVRASHLAHDIAVVDLADYLERSAPGLRYVAESEIRPFLDQIASPPRRVWGDTRHRADGLLVDGTRCIAVE